MTKATVKQEYTPFVIWDTCAIAQAAADQMVKEAKERGEDLSEEEALDLVWGDQGLIDYEWNSLCDRLTELMNRINPDGCRWDAQVHNFGWRSLDGRKDAFSAETGRELLEAVLPRTDCKFHVFDEGDHIRIRNWHHDSPSGDEYYIIEVHRSEEE